MVVSGGTYHKLGGGGGLWPDHNFWSHDNHFLLLLILDPVALKTCKNTIKIEDLRVLSQLGVFKDRPSS